MATHKFYPQNAQCEAATVTDLTGTSSSRDNMLNYRRASLCNVDTVSAGEYAFRLDMLSLANAIAPVSFVFIDHNLRTLTGNVKIMTGSADTGAAWDETWVDVAAPAGCEPIWIQSMSIVGPARRYFRVQVTSIDATAYWGCFFLVTIPCSPSVDCNYGQPKIRDYGGTVVNITSGGAKFATQRYGTRIIHTFLYETITTADKDILLTLESLAYGSLKPFAFIVDEGGVAVNKYGRLVTEGMQVIEVVAGLWNVQFAIEEEIA